MGDEMGEKTPCPVCDGSKPLWKSQRGMLVVYLAFLTFALLIVDAVWAKVDPIGLTAFTGTVIVAGAYFFKARGDEAKAAAK